MSVANGALAMPYPGLRPFEDKDQPLFFGREAQVSAMLVQLEDHRFVAVVGSSGSGKSSLVRAGLLPAVREGFLLGTTDWLTIIIKPGHQPYQRLVRALSVATCRIENARVIPAYDDPLAPNEIATLTMLRRTDRGLLTALDQFAISPQSRVMVVVDQFEELFAFRRAGVNRDTVASRDQAAAFVGMLIRSASDPAGRVWAILTMRSDFIGDCEAFLGLPEEISKSQFLVPRLDRGQMEEAITRPASVEEGAFKTFTFEEGLVNRIINDAGDRPDQLPLMQHALMRTWKHAVARAGMDGPVTVMPEDYEAAGGIEMALSLHADAAWDEIKDDPKNAHIARRLFLLLCDISPDGQITRRRPLVAEVQSVTGASVAEIEQVVRVFQQDDRNFLLPPPPQHLTAESYLDICHEALLRQWRLFAGEWQEQERRDASELRRLAELASLRKQGQGGSLPAEDLERIDRWKRRVSAEWARRYVTNEEWEEALSFVEESRAGVKREEEQRQKQARYKRSLVRVVALILLAATGVSVWLMKNANEAKVAAQEALTRTNEAKAAAQEALTRSFVRTIGVSSSGTLQPDEQAALWELAELHLANVPVRERVIDYWFGSEEYVARALKCQMQGLHAAVGLNLALRNHSASKADEMADRLAKELENPQQTNAKRLKLGQALAALATRMEPKGTAGFSARGAQVLAKALKDPKTTAYAYQPYQWSGLNDALAALAARIEPKDAASVADSLAKGLEDPKTNAYQLAALSKALVALAARMEPKEAASVSSRGAQVLVKGLEDPKTSAYLWDLGETLAALAARLEAKEVADVSARGAQVLAKVLKDPKTDAYVYQLWALSSDALSALAARMESKDAASVADSLAKGLENPKTDAYVYQLAALSKALVALEARMEPKEAASVSSCGAQVLVKALKDPTTESNQLSVLRDALTALATRMEPNDAASVAESLAKGLEDSQETDAYRLSLIGSALGRLSLRVPPARQTRCLALSIILLNEFPEAPKLPELEEAKRRKEVTDLCALIDPQDLAEVLKWPFSVGEAEKITLAELEKKTGRKFDGDIWKFVEQAPSLGIKDLDAPAKRPNVKDALTELGHIIAQMKRD